jgi:hypothetical protein
MTDSMTKEPLRVSTDGTAGPYIRLPESQLHDVRRLLDAQSIRHWVGENAISWNGGPETVVVNLGRDGDPSTVQAILDNAR